MKKRIFKLFITAAILIAAVNVFGQGTAELSGKAMSGKDILTGATVVAVHSESGQKYGSIADIDGVFKIENMKTGAYTVTVSLIGYATSEQKISLAEGNKDLGVISLEGEDISIAEISVMASIAVDRKTPVAISSIKPEIILEKLGTKEFPEILKSTPSVYATKRGGAYGDSRINMRGFSSENIAVMINGVPVNDMEWGGIYWSNWAGLSDVTRSMQVQRGLGASKIAVPSVGGSINMLTNTTNAKQGGSISTMTGNDGYQKISFSVSTGLTEKGWAVSLLGARTKGDGYIMGTEFEGYSYFLNVSKRINNKHLISFTGFGAPQWHNQRSTFDMKTIAEWQKYKDGYKYNAAYGFGVDGQRKNSARNFYHKPQFSLNHFWTLDENTSLSTALYYSTGTGGGYTSLGNNSGALFGSSTYRTVEGYLDYATVMNENAANLNGSQAVLASSNNNHQWAGVISNFNKRFSDKLNFSGGVDLRYYIGEHNRTVKDLMGGSFFIDATRQNVPYRAGDTDYINERLYVGDVVGRNYFGHVLWEGLFGQVEYTPIENLSTFVAASVSNTSYWRVDKMYYDEANEKSETVNFLGYSGKGGANYNLNENHNVFANVGYFSRAPFFSSVFVASNVSNVINQNAINEEVISAEIGYGMRYKYFSMNLNLYNTIWKNKQMVRAIDTRDPNRGTYNAEGINATHRGVEVDFVFKPGDKLNIRGMFSIGDWKWMDDVVAYAYNKDGQAVNGAGVVVDPLSDAHYKQTFLIGGVHVDDAAQTSASIGINYELLKGLKFGIDANYFAQLYSKVDITIANGSDTWEVPDYYTIDGNIVYNFKFANLNSNVYFNVDNLLDAEYIADATNGSASNWETSTVFYGFGRTWSLGVKINF